MRSGRRNWTERDRESQVGSGREDGGGLGTCRGCGWWRLSQNSVNWREIESGQFLKLGGLGMIGSLHLPGLNCRTDDHGHTVATVDSIAHKTRGTIRLHYSCASYW